VRVDGQWIDVYKDPITDKGKQSKRGRLTLLRDRRDGSYRSALLDEVAAQVDSEDALVTVWENGVMQQEWTLEQVRARADAARR
jgi:nicotinamide phosphoribosyltransferase